MKGITITEIAKLAGVSATTVSNVLNHKKRYSEVTENKIRNIAKNHNYQVNLSARALVTKSSNLIGLVVSSTYKSYYHSVALKIIHGVQAGLKNSALFSDYDLVIHDYSDSTRLSNWINKRNLEGIIFLGEIPHQGLKCGIHLPAITIDSYTNDNPFCNISVQDTELGFLITEHLINKGHKNIAFVGEGDLSDLEFSSAKEKKLLSEVDYRRYLGYESALVEYGLKIFEPILITEQTPLKIALKEIKEATKLNYDAIISANPFITEEILGILQGGSDLKLASFGENSLWKLTTPKVIGVKENSIKKGQVAISTLEKLFKKPNTKLEDLYLSGSID